MRFSGAQRIILPWLHDEIEEMQALMGKKTWAYGVEPNRETLETFMKHLVDQHYLAHVEPIDEHFTPIISWSE